jgi:hypothetical protein
MRWQDYRSFSPHKAFHSAILIGYSEDTNSFPWVLLFFYFSPPVLATVSIQIRVCAW